MKTLPIILITLTIIIISLSFAFKLLYEDNQQTQNLTQNLSAIRIIDGDTIETAEGEIIRLLCVDTPEEGKKGYNEAIDYLSLQLIGKDILIERIGKDRYNRTLAWINIDNVLINKEIVDNGFGTLFEYNDTDCGRMK